jgi:O-antigen ligase
VNRSDIPIFHNGYVYLLVKVGALGLFLYVLFLYRILASASRKRRDATRGRRYLGERIATRLLVLFVVLITAVFFGIFSNAVANNIVILLAVLAAMCKEQQASSPPERLGVHP